MIIIAETDCVVSGGAFARCVSSQVVDPGFCIGCGVCANFCPRDYLRMRMTGAGEWRPCDAAWACPDQCGRCLKVCPFPGAHASYTNSATQDVDGSLCLIGHRGDRLRELSASGGLVTLLLERALTHGIVDCAVCVRPTGIANPLFEMSLARSIGEVRSASSSAYYPVELSGVLSEIRKTPGSYAITCLPCAAKAIALARRHDGLLNERIALVIGLACSQGKTAQFTEAIAAVHAGRSLPVGVNYRKKRESRPAWDYGFSMTWSDSEESVTIGYSESIRAPWTARAFTPRACFYCDDLLADAADVCAMDAWLPAYVVDPLGHSILLAHSEQGETALRTLSDQATIHACDPAVCRQAQAPGIQNKSAALAYRLWRRRRRGPTPPVSRVAPDRGRLAWTSRLLEAVKEDFADWSRRRCTPAMSFEEARSRYRAVQRIAVLIWAAETVIGRLCRLLPQPESQESGKVQ